MATEGICFDLHEACALIEELVQPWLNVIYAIGEAFRKRILAE